MSSIDTERDNDKMIRNPSNLTTILFLAAIAVALAFVLPSSAFSVGKAFTSVGGMSATGGGATETAGGASPTSADVDLLNSAFVFVKPHANNAKVQEKVRSMLLQANLEIISEGDISGKTIDEEKLIDQHYYAIASKATLLDPKDIPVPTDKFQEFFGEAWQDVLQQNRAANAMQACERLGLDANQLEDAWRKCEPENKVVKFGGGFYCGLIDSIEGKDPLYVFNAFFMNMRSRFTGDDCSIHYYVVQWKASDLSWERFRGSILGPTDPGAAPEGSIRKTIFDEWQDLGLKEQPNKGDNGVHASASPFEGLAEKLNWISTKVDEDSFGKALLDAGIPTETIQAWSVDPRVSVPSDGSSTELGSLFDALEDLDASDCLAKCIEIQKAT